MERKMFTRPDAGALLLCGIVYLAGIKPLRSTAATNLDLVPKNKIHSSHSAFGQRQPDLCKLEDWSLDKKNWTDGDPRVQAIKICTYMPHGGTEADIKQDCRSMFTIPKVAMLFLTMGNMRHEALWSLWFKQAGLLVPKDCLTAAACDTQKPAGLAHSYTTCLRSKKTILEQQVLFSVYVHPPPGFAPYAEASLFHGREIADRVNSSWGTFDLAQVARNLMKAALDDQLNQRFMTVSESCIPLYTPSIIYHQLMYAEKSRINACTTRENWGRDEYRWTFRFESSTDGRLSKAMWRKNHQWLGLTRKHARLTVADEEIAAVFSKHCFSGEDPDYGNWWRTCFSDEHYFSTLLAFHGLDNETDCMGELTHTFWCSWCAGDERLHPKTYKPEETSVDLLTELRQESSGCNSEDATDAAAQLLISLSDLGGQEECIKPVDATASLLPPRCPLFARKFSDGSPAAVLHASFSLMLLDERRQLRRREAACMAVASDQSTGAHSLESNQMQPKLRASDLSEPDDTSRESISDYSESSLRAATLETVMKTVQDAISRNNASSSPLTRAEKRQIRRRNRTKQGNFLL